VHEGDCLCPFIDRFVRAMLPTSAHLLTSLYGQNRTQINSQLRSHNKVSNSHKDFVL
jgi:hypothetical protein